MRIGRSLKAAKSIGHGNVTRHHVVVGRRMVSSFHKNVLTGIVLSFMMVVRFTAASMPNNSFKFEAQKNS
jgi:hypothetical protein